MTPADLGDSPILLDTDVFSFVVWSRGPAAVYELNAKFKDQVGMNDLWIAACALSQNPVLPVASHDHAFEMIAAEFNLPVVRINAA